VLSDGYVAGIVAHLSKDELERFDLEQGALTGNQNESAPKAVGSQGE